VTYHIQSSFIIKLIAQVKHFELHLTLDYTVFYRGSSFLLATVHVVVLYKHLSLRHEVVFDIFRRVHYICIYALHNNISYI